MPIFNFHEGGNVGYPTWLGKLNFGEPSDFHFRRLGPEEFSLDRDTTELRFRYVGKVDEWVSNAVLAGDYRDASGGEYRFRTDGFAEFPHEKPFPYFLATDHVLNNYDYIASAEPPMIRAVSITARGVSIFDVGGDHEDVVSETPHWVLTRVSAVNCR